jgi:hypothetical protein
MSNEDKIRYYKNLLYYVRLVRDNLGNAMSYVNDIKSNMADAYSIDDSAADDGYLSSRYSDINTLYNSLRYTIIPRIEREIDALEATSGGDE